MQAPSFEETVEQIVAKDPRYQRDAYFFVREALDHTQKMIGKPPKKEEIRHVTGQQLLDGIRDYALQQFGPMALTLLEAWGIRNCEHFGEIVFNMVEAKVLSKTENDSRDDFKNGYDFHETFCKPFLPAARLNAPQPEARRS